MTTATTLATPPVPAVNLSGEAAAGPWEAVIAVAIAAAALLYLARSYGFLGKRKKPGCAECASGCGCGSQSTAPDAKACTAPIFVTAPDNTERRDA
ncbi:hypothetical protein [Blastochloris tepida]|uniref:FeoB-associated Cys-rich membrane protein n=1 Tax=Blastochloris tepida TaxID=2233851 RepID=A0A348FXE8_9HYPH|nr:hypothetical protein [Blastochloris tepida]BBF91981.1 hypothetical protein BLTE_06660 [Blastochloris tepida]